MTRIEQYEAQLARCCGPAPKPYVPPKPLTGIAKHERELDSIEFEYQKTFGKDEAK